jgi:hypothetical protein
MTYPASAGFFIARIFAGFFILILFTQNISSKYYHYYHAGTVAE